MAWNRKQPTEFSLYVRLWEIQHSKVLYDMFFFLNKQTNLHTHTGMGWFNGSSWDASPLGVTRATACLHSNNLSCDVLCDSAKTQFTVGEETISLGNICWRGTWNMCVCVSQSGTQAQMDDEHGQRRRAVYEWWLKVLCPLFPLSPTCPDLPKLHVEVGVRAFFVCGCVLLTLWKHTYFYSVWCGDLSPWWEGC